MSEWRKACNFNDAQEGVYPAIVVVKVEDGHDLEPSFAMRRNGGWLLKAERGDDGTWSAKSLLYRVWTTPAESEEAAVETARENIKGVFE